MKKLTTILTLFILFLHNSYAQLTSPYLLKEPVAWEFETFALPPVFAPNFPYKGVEELRFAPGMFKKDSADYFTYSFVAQLDNTSTISKDNLRNYLLQYFKGLCRSTANDRKLIIDTSKINVSIERKKAHKPVK